MWRKDACQYDNNDAHQALTPRLGHIMLEADIIAQAPSIDEVQTFRSSLDTGAQASGHKRRR